MHVPNINSNDVVIGLGQTGLSIIRFLSSKGKTFKVLDTRINPPNLEQIKRDFPNLEIYLGELDENILLNANNIIVSPGVSTHILPLKKARSEGVNIIGDIELFINVTDIPIIAITGSNGKSTVTSLLGKMAENCGLKVGVGGNIGIPVLDLLNQDKKFNLFVIELSSFQLETINSFNFACSTILNISPDHLDRYNDFKHYALSKQKIYNNCKKAVVNRDDPLTLENIKTNDIISFGLDYPKEGHFGTESYNDQKWLNFGSKKLLKVKDLQLMGMHNCANVLAALALGYNYGLPLEPMIETAKIYQGLEHRCQLVKEKNGVKWINDSKGTNVGATNCALQSIGQLITGKIIWLAGGRSKDADFNELKQALPFIKQLIYFGQDGSQIAKIFQGDIPCKQVNNMQEAVLAAKFVAKANDVVLLSPACTSFDQYNNFMERGEDFIEQVKKSRLGLGPTKIN